MPGRVFGNWGFLCFRNSSPDITTAWDLHRLRIRSGCCFWNQGWYYLLPCRITLREFLRTKLKPLWGCNCEIASSLAIQDRLINQVFFSTNQDNYKSFCKTRSTGMEIMRKHMVRSKPKERENGSETIDFPGGRFLGSSSGGYFFYSTCPSQR